MNKHTIITLVAIGVIVAPFLYSALNIYGVEQLQYRWDSPGEFSFFTMSNHGQIEFCNIMPFWTNIQRLEITSFYEKNNLGSFVAEHIMNNPFSSTVQSGVFSSKELQASQHVFMTMDFELDGGDIRLDPNQFIVIIKADTPILGLIPYSIYDQLDIVDFDSMMNAQDLVCN